MLPGKVHWCIPTFCSYMYYRIRNKYVTTVFPATGVLWRFQFSFYNTWDDDQNDAHLLVPTKCYISPWWYPLIYMWLHCEYKDTLLQLHIHLGHLRPVHWGTCSQKCILCYTIITENGRVIKMMDRQKINSHIASAFPSESPMTRSFFLSNAGEDASYLLFQWSFAVLKSSWEQSNKCLECDLAHSRRLSMLWIIYQCLLNQTMVQCPCRHLFYGSPVTIISSPTPILHDLLDATEGRAVWRQVLTFLYIQMMVGQLQLLRGMLNI